ncbi:MAG: amino acid ABC transporter permease [Hyphomicrobiaceae bacterium]
MAITTKNKGSSTAHNDGDGDGSLLSLLNKREVREAIYQVIIVVALVALFWMFISNTLTNLKKQNIASGFGFWNQIAGFDIAQHLIEYSSRSSYGRAFWVGLLNTLVVSIIGIILATLVGFVMGVARLSSNWLIARIGTIYVEIARNIPLLLQLFIWYFAVLKNLPAPRNSVAIPGGSFLNVRGLFLPQPLYAPGIEWVGLACLLGIIGSIAIAIWSRRRQMLTGQRFPVLLSAIGLVIGLPLLIAAVLGFPILFEYPELKGFNFQGGLVVSPEFMALLFGLVFYTGAYIAELVRAGIQGVGKGQKEAARAMGLSTGQMLRLVVIPQAMRIIIPPLTSQYLNLTKNSSLAVAIGYPDLVSVFAGTVLNQTGQAIEVIFITMLVYLTLSLTTSLFMNWFNARMALVER